MIDLRDSTNRLLRHTFGRIKDTALLAFSGSGTYRISILVQYRLEHAKRKGSEEIEVFDQATAIFKMVE